ncbi:unnamed protein product [Haemonchus placei]|uniref:Uncharacterized protein n=1 Tax=Haemonchus placei TaxID=6290 RepID=A0A3P7YPU4_HAEPC|nr:unnamed protein product [Haemonchus placei]
MTGSPWKEHQGGRIKRLGRKGFTGLQRLASGTDGDVAGSRSSMSMINLVPDNSGYVE